MENNKNTLPQLPTGEQMSCRFLPHVDWEEQDIDDDWLDPTDEIETSKNVLYVGQAPICSLGGFTVLTGQSGHGKTQTTAMMISAILRGRFGTLRRGDDVQAPVVLYIDTEMEKYNTQRLMNRIYHIVGWPTKSVHDDFRILRLRSTTGKGQYTSQQIRAMKTWKAIKLMSDYAFDRPLFVFIDGLIDLVKSINDDAECSELINNILAAAEYHNCSITGIIHQNPGGDKIAGHLGSFGERKSITVLCTKKDKTTGEIIFYVEQKKARDKDADNIKFRIEDDVLHIGIPVPLDVNEVKQLQAQEHEELRAILTKYVPTPGSISQTQLQKEIKIGEHIGSNKAYDMIVRAFNEGILNKSEVTGKYSINFDDPLNPDNIEQQRLEF